MSSIGMWAGKRFSTRKAASNAPRPTAIWAKMKTRVEECQQRHHEEPHQEGRTRPAIVVRAEQDREGQVADRQQRQCHVSPGQHPQRRREQPESRDGKTENVDVRPGLGIVEKEEERDRRAEQRAEEMADQEHAHALFRMRIPAHRFRREPVDQKIKPADEFHRSRPRPVAKRQSGAFGFRSRKLWMTPDRPDFRGSGHCQGD
jgi:hypothetical protein